MDTHIEYYFNCPKCGTPVTVEHHPDRVESVNCENCLGKISLTGKFK